MCCLSLLGTAPNYLGIAASFLRSPSNVEAPSSDIELAGDGSGAVDRAIVIETIKEDFRRSYFVTGNLTLNAYEEDCEFADPAGSFKGLRRFKRNCTNFGYLLEKSDMKLMKWEDFELLDIQSIILMHNLEKFAGSMLPPRHIACLSFFYVVSSASSNSFWQACGALEYSQNGSTEANSKA
ncbi:hypothetical protein L1049_012831 [Liquidambar formosana]|uniref:Uncharacterized protein n=1 Tax=Liquidambar formosana TaxID=63359 RepID=A0AAP0RLR1_LIQFO